MGSQIGRSLSGSSHLYLDPCIARDFAAYGNILEGISGKSFFPLRTFTAVVRLVPCAHETKGAKLL